MLKRWRVKRFISGLAALLLGLSFTVPLAYARGGGGGGHMSGGNGDTIGPKSEPKGWDEGKKEGWKGKEEPPGLEKQGNKDKDKDKGHKNKKGNKEEKKENAHAQENENERGRK